MKVEKEKTGDSIFHFLFPHCGARRHQQCPVMMPRIGDKRCLQQWLGWQHCSCPCHKFTKTKDGYSAKPNPEWENGDVITKLRLMREKP